MKISIDYPVNPKPRYGYGKSPHSKIFEILNCNRETYKSFLESFIKYKDYLSQIKITQSNTRPLTPYWNNNWFSGLDAAALYGFLVLNNPATYFEIGSGMSTKFAQQAIIDHDLRTKIISIDPNPRAEIDCLCNDIIRIPIEAINTNFFNEIQNGDFLFIDGSHRIFMNSDVAVVFLDILPYLKKRVLVHFHDIFLPFDYPPHWKERYYSEQYMLAATLLAEGNKFEVILPNTFISSDSQLKVIMSPLWETLEMNKPEMIGGGSFWIEKK
ncbi:MAG: class I SAM-dependent methyltransferase [Clostridiales bacterium]|nr:class I SAM-dependent methyltransferase [Clostridiales bacterium]MCF8022845.1 class I SAM-dependent methyltransferase [Clostridiales bacterium]